MLTQEELHKKILYPVVRCQTEKSGGSGTVIYSESDPDNPEEYISMVLTCQHVIDDAIVIKEDWDSVVKRMVKKEFTRQVNVEIFDYVYMSKVNSSNSYKADIVAYDKTHDIAILKIESPKKCPYTAKLLPREKIKDVKLFTPTWNSGCSLGHDPLTNYGYITYLSEMIENKLYWGNSAASIFGNSGGATFLAETGEQIGITARITTLQLGFGVDVITWMGFIIPPQRLYDFFDEQELKFIYDSSDTYKKAMVRRSKKQKKTLLELASAAEEKEDGE